MKEKFSTKWRGSRQKRKQVKYRENAPLHIRHKFMAANLSKILRGKYGRRSFPVRKGDSVKVMRGKFKKKTGKISSVDLQKLRVGIEGLQIQKKDGTKVNVYFNTSNLQIQELNLDDKNRVKALERKKTGKKVEDKKREEEETKKPEKKKNVSKKK